MQQEQRPLVGRLIIVTGASSGVGYALTRHLVQQEGAVVVAVARRRVFRVEALAKQVGVDRLFSVTADMAAPGQASALVQMTLEKWGRVDGFVHAVNRSLRLTALDVSDAEFDLTMQVNVKSALYGVQAVAPVFREQGHGAIVVYNPTPECTDAFAASEAVVSAAACALSALCEGWQRQLDGTGVSVEEVCPPPGEPAGEGAHDLLLAEALRDGLPDGTPVHVNEPLPTFAASEPFPLAAPVVLSTRGCLALTQF